MQDGWQEELWGRHWYLPWALEVQGTLVGLASRHPPEERVVEAAASDLDTLATTLCPPQHSCSRLSPTLVIPGRGASPSPPRPSRAGVGSDLPLSPAPTSPGPARMASAGVCRRNGRAGEGEEFVLQSTMILWALSAGQGDKVPARWVRGGRGQGNLQRNTLQRDRK